MIKSERIKMPKRLRKELEKVRPNLLKQNYKKLSDEDMIQLEAEINELSNILIDSYLGQFVKKQNH